jgi:hypothetical protein
MAKKQPTIDFALDLEKDGTLEIRLSGIPEHKWTQVKFRVRRDGDTAMYDYLLMEIQKMETPPPARSAEYGPASNMARVKAKKAQGVTA